MRRLIVSDIHANLTALEAVLDAAAPFDSVWCLGDVVGYGPDPNACIEKLRNLPDLVCIKGNHDAAILDEIDVFAFNHEARQSLDWLRSRLKADNRQWLADLEEKVVLGDVTLAHGSPRNPIWEYIMDLETARENMAYFETQICLVGHTHIPCIYQMEDDAPDSTGLYFPEAGLALKLQKKFILNPGSVGQPRDHDPQASFVIYDDLAESWVYHRVSYEVKQVQKRILAAGLPRRHAYRLEEGW